MVKRGADAIFRADGDSHRHLRSFQTFDNKGRFAHSKLVTMLLRPSFVALRDHVTRAHALGAEGFVALRGVVKRADALGAEEVVAL